MVCWSVGLCCEILLLLDGADIVHAKGCRVGCGECLVCIFRGCGCEVLVGIVATMAQYVGMAWLVQSCLSCLLAHLAIQQEVSAATVW